VAIADVVVADLGRSASNQRVYGPLLVETSSRFQAPFNRNGQLNIEGAATLGWPGVSAQPGRLQILAQVADLVFGRINQRHPDAAG